MIRIRINHNYIKQTNRSIRLTLSLPVWNWAHPSVAGRGREDLDRITPL